MAKRFKERELEQKHGDLTKVIPPLVNAHGQAEAARQLETSQAFISTWLKKNKFKARRTTWEREGEPA